MKKILLASQYKTLLHKYSNLLSNWGFKIFLTTSGAEALRLIKEHHFDLIVSDFELEGMSISAICSMIRQGENAPHTPIIITCHNIPSRIERAKQIGASAIVLKPVNPIKLLETIGNHVGLHLIRGKRVALRTVVTIKASGRELTCTTSDVSTTGILIKSDYELTVGNLITCRFTLPDWGQVEIDGEIVRYMTNLECDNLYGVKFTAIKTSQQNAICEYVSLCLKERSSAKTLNSGSHVRNKHKVRTIEGTIQVSDIEQCPEA